MSDTSTSPSGEVPFEHWLQKLEAIVRQLEEGQLGLGDALARYEEGIGYLKQCHTSLDDAERRIELLTGVDAEGRPTVAPFDDEQLSDEAKSGARSRRRSRPSAPAPQAPAPRAPAPPARPENHGNESRPDADDHSAGRLF